MPFSYIGKNAEGRPIIRNNNAFSPKMVSDPKKSFYWLVFDWSIESKYWPK